MGTFRETLAHVTGLLAVPYGYAVTLWAASRICQLHFGVPQVLGIIGFVFGGVSAFVVLALLHQPPAEPRTPQRISSVIEVNVMPLVSLVLSPIGLLVPWAPVGFWLSAFLVTLGYGLAVAWFVHLDARRQP